MKSTFAVVGVILSFVCLLAADSVATETLRGKELFYRQFRNPEAVAEDIKLYHKDVLEQRVNRIYLLEILGAEDDPEKLYVYYIVDRKPSAYKNRKGHVTADRAPIRVATYQYSYLKGVWTIRRADVEYKGDYVFRDV